MCYQELGDVIAGLRSTRVTVDDQPITMSLLREEKQKLEKRIELYQSEVDKDRHNYNILEGQVCRTSSFIIQPAGRMHSIAFCLFL